jgi:hypothetical protein
MWPALPWLTQGGCETSVAHHLRLFADSKPQEDVLHVSVSSDEDAASQIRQAISQWTSAVGRRFGDHPGLVRPVDD